MTVYLPKQNLKLFNKIQHASVRKRRPPYMGGNVFNQQRHGTTENRYEPSAQPVPVRGLNNLP